MFVVFEGGEGCGKSTQANLLTQELSRRGISCRLTREPGGTPLAESIRTLFKMAQGDEPTALAELHLVMAARAQHVARVVLPALARGEVVVCDRFLDSSYVYQGTRGGLSKETIDDAARPILGALVPDLTFLLHVPVEVAVARMASRPAETAGRDRLDSLGTEKLAALSNGFLALAENRAPYPNGFIPERMVVDATRAPNDIFTDILAAFVARRAR